MDSSSLIGQQVGNWRLTRLLGEGGMSVVYLGKHAWLDQLGAVKLLRPELCKDPHALQRFEQEALSAGKLAHENIIQIRDFGQGTNGHYFMVLELLNGEELESCMGKAPLPAHWIGAIMEQVCSALASTHEAGIIHRDLKPSNIFLLPGDFYPVVKILDFGIAKVNWQEEDKKLTRTGMILGTPAYLAPEQLVSTTELTAAIDIYSLGVILYQMLTGFLPVDGGNMIEHALLVLQQTPAKLGEHRPELAGSMLETLMVSILAKNPAHRPASIVELGTALQQAIAQFDDPLKNQLVPVIHNNPELSMEGMVEESTEIIHAGSVASDTVDGMNAPAVQTIANPVDLNGNPLLPTSAGLVEGIGSGGLDNRTARGVVPHPGPAKSNNKMIFLVVIGLFVAVIAASVIGGLVSNWMQNGRKVKEPKRKVVRLTTLDKLALEGTKAFRRGKYALAVKYWKQALKSKKANWRKSKYYPELYKQIGVGLSRQNYTHSAMVFYQRYIAIQKKKADAYRKLEKKDGSFNMNQFLTEMDSFKKIKKTLTDKLAEGRRLFGLFKLSVRTGVWGKPYKLYLQIKKLAPSVPSLHYKLSLSFSEILPKLSLDISNNILKFMEPQKDMVEKIGRLQIKLKHQVQKREEEISSFFEKADKLIAARKSRKALRYLKKKIKARRHLTQVSNHRAFDKWSRKFLQNDTRLALSLMNMFRKKLLLLDKLDLGDWLEGQGRGSFNSNTIKARMGVIVLFRKTQKSIDKVDALVKKGLFTAAIRSARRFFKYWKDMEQMDLWNYRGYLSRTGKNVTGLVDKLKKGQALEKKAQRAFKEARFRKVRIYHAMLRKTLGETLAKLEVARRNRTRERRMRTAEKIFKQAQRYFRKANARSGKSTIRRKEWTKARLLFTRYKKLFPANHRRKQITKYIHTCDCGLGVTWEQCKNN